MPYLLSKSNSNKKSPKEDSDQHLHSKKQFHVISVVLAWMEILRIRKKRKKKKKEKEEKSRLNNRLKKLY